jgi:hypothetical protein
MNGSLRDSLPDTKPGIRSKDCVQGEKGCKGRVRFLAGFFRILTIGGNGNRMVAEAFAKAGKFPTDASATVPLGIVSFLLTPQDTRLRILTTFSDALRSICGRLPAKGDRIGKNLRVVP